MADIRMIAMDMDGTLLNDAGGISPDNVSALLKAQEKGVIIAGASGRFPSNVSLIFKDYGFNGPIVGTNGAEIMNRPLGRMIFTKPMAPAAARAVQEILEEHRAEYFMFSPYLVTTSSPNAIHHTELSFGRRILDEGGVHYAHGPQAVLETLEKVIYKYYVCDNGALPRLREALRLIPGIFLTKSGENNIEIMPEGVDKGTGVRWLARYLGIPMENVMTLGDQDNDLPMLMAAGYGVAMGNAPDAVKEKTRYVTARCDECGVARAVERFAL